MLSLPLSAAAGVLAASGLWNQIGAKERQAWQSMQDSVVQIVRSGRSTGSAALVDSKGLFLTHQGTIYADRVSGRLSDGRTVSLVVKASDGPTQLVVLQAEDWIRSAEPFTPAHGLRPGDKLLAILPSGLIRAEFVSGKRYGVVAPSRRLMQLSEISFEAPADTIGGAMVVTSSGRLVGFLNAALRSEADVNTQIKPTELLGRVKGADTALRDPILKAAEALLGAPERRYGPADMTVAYTPAPSAMSKALHSLLKGNYVPRPSIGVDVRNAEGGGALIDAVHEGSSAAAAGLQRGDVVLQIDARKIGDQVDLAKAVMEHEIGSTMRVKLRRGRLTLTVPVVVQGRSTKPVAGPASTT